MTPETTWRIARIGAALMVIAGMLWNATRADASAPICSDPQSQCHRELKRTGVFLRGTTEQQQAAVIRCLDNWDRRYSAPGIFPPKDAAK